VPDIRENPTANTRDSMPKAIDIVKRNTAVCTMRRQYYRMRCRKLKSVIFVATTGRSGTMTLADIFNQVPGCKAEHEPFPAMYDEVLKAKSTGDEDYVKKIYWQMKSLNLWRAAAGSEHYLESNHLFIKTYIEYAVKDFSDRVMIIHLIRDPVEVANSIYTLQQYPGTIEGDKWWLDYRARDNIISIANVLDNDPGFKHPFYKGLWYWYEIEERIKNWEMRLSNIRFIEFNTEDCNDRDKLLDLFKSLNIDFDIGILSKEARTQSNTRPHHKLAEPISRETADNMHEKFLSLLDSLNIKSSRVD